MSNKTQAKKRRELERATTPNPNPLSVVDNAVHAKRDDEYRDVPLDQIHFDPNQPRRKILEEELMELYGTIKAEGLQQPITITWAYRKDGVDHYYIKYGERRYIVHQRLGLKTIKCIVKYEEYDGTLCIDRLLKQSSENTARVPQSHLENIRVVRLVVENALSKAVGDKTHGIVQVALQRVADAHGKKISWAKVYHELSRLHSDIQEMLDHEGVEKLNIQVARSLSAVPLEQQQKLLEDSAPYFKKGFHVGLSFVAREARALREKAGHKMRGRQSEHKDNFKRFSDKLLKLCTQFQGPVKSSREWNEYAEKMVASMTVIEAEQMAGTLLQASFPFAQVYHLCEQKRSQHLRELGVCRQL